MASITFKSGDEYALKLSKLGACTDKIVKKAVYSGAKVVADKIKENLKKNVSDSSTGDLLNSMGITPMLIDSSGNYNVHIGFDGYDRKGVPNKVKACVLESGTSRGQKKRPFVRPAINATKKQCIEEMKKAIDIETTKIMEGK